MAGPDLPAGQVEGTVIRYAPEQLEASRSSGRNG